MATVIYRQSVVFPPDQGDYEPLAQKRRAKGKPPFPDELAQLASQGLSIFLDLDAMRRHAQRYPHLGPLIVRYSLPDSLDFTIEHVLGDPSHMTPFMPNLKELARFLDGRWLEDLG